MIKLTLKNNKQPIYVRPASVDVVLASVRGEGCVICVGRLTYEVAQTAEQVLEYMGLKGR